MKQRLAQKHTSRGHSIKVACHCYMLYKKKQFNIKVQKFQCQITKRKSLLPTKAPAYLKKDKGKVKKELLSGKVPKTKLSAEGVPGTSILVDRLIHQMVYRC